MKQTPIYQADEVITSEEEKLAKLRHSTNREIARIKTVWPLEFFPKEVVVTENKIDLVYHNFFFSQTVFPILIKDLRNVVVSTNFFFGSLEFELRGYETNPQVISRFWRNDALQIREVITGLMMSEYEGVDLSQVDDRTLRENIQAMGKVG